MMIDPHKVMLLLIMASISCILQAKPKPYEATPEEIAMMPKGCQAKLSPSLMGNAELQMYWSNRVGPGCWVHMHHFCQGLKSMMRAKLTFENADKRFYLGQAIGEFDYVLQHCPGASPIIPEVRNQKQQATNLLNAIPH